jgi:hypothetical protein
MAARRSISSAAGRQKIADVMHEWKAGELHSGSKQGPRVVNRRQAIAIAINQARSAGRRKGK